MLDQTETRPTWWEYKLHMDNSKILGIPTNPQSGLYKPPQTKLMPFYFEYVGLVWINAHKNK